MMRGEESIVHHSTVAVWDSDRTVTVTVVWDSDSDSDSGVRQALAEVVPSWVHHAM